MESPIWFTNFGGLIIAAVTAVATIFLWLVTRSLAVETRRMVDASSQPHVVATIDPNRWSMRHADLNVDNTGNATAYDIQISFEPPLLTGMIGPRAGAIPFQQVSVLKPGQGLSSYLSEFEPLLGKTYTVTISWRRNASKNARETNTYMLNVSEKEKLTQLGASDPLIQIAEQMKKIQEQWSSVASGSRKLKTDVFTSDDRILEQHEIERLRTQTEKSRI